MSEEEKVDTHILEELPTQSSITPRSRHNANFFRSGTARAQSGVDGRREHVSNHL